LVQRGDTALGSSPDIAEPRAAGAGYRVPAIEKGRHTMGRYLLLWLLGIPLPILLLIWAFGGLH